MAQQKLSIVVITKNEEANIGRCIASARWADEVIVVDSFSTDRTAELAAELGARVITRAWEGFAVQKEFAVAQARNEWVLSLDADEQVTEALRAEIEQVLAPGEGPAGYRMPRKSFFLGRWMRYGGWYPGYQLRLFRRSAARMVHRPVHEGFEVEGAVGTLAAPINHYTYDTLHQYLEKMNDYTSLDVMNKLSGRPGRIRWYHCIFSPLSMFLRMFVSLRGYRDGFHGFLLAAYSSLYSLLVYAKCWEYQRAERDADVLPPVTAAAIAAAKRR